METYKLIIKKSVNMNINFFSLDYKKDEINWYIKFAFITLESLINNKNKYKVLYDLLNGFLLKDKQDRQDEFLEYFCKIQKNYSTLNRFVYKYKFKKTKLVVNTDMCLNELDENDKNIICILDSGSRYLFHINDLINMINTSLTNSSLFFCQPKSIKNPYNNLPFNKSTLYNIFFFIKYKTNYFPELFFKFYECDFNLTKFKILNEYLLRDYSIKNFVYKTPYNFLEEEVRQMISFFNVDCNKYRVKNRILIHKDFSKQKLVEIMRPYLLLYFKALYSFHPEIKKRFLFYFKITMFRFNKFNPYFGRKEIKLIYKTCNFKKKVCGKEITFNDKCIKFYNIEKQNNTFLTNHLNYFENISDYISDDYIHNFIFEEDDEEEEEEDDEEEEEEDDEEEEEEEEEEDYTN